MGLLHMCTGTKGVLCRGALAKVAANAFRRQKLSGGLLTAGIAALALGAEYAYGPAALPFKAVASAVLALLNLTLWWPEFARFFTRRRR
jgi:hypothetical protein